MTIKKKKKNFNRFPKHTCRTEFFSEKEICQENISLENSGASNKQKRVSENGLNSNVEDENLIDSDLYSNFIFEGDEMQNTFNLGPNTNSPHFEEISLCNLESRKKSRHDYANSKSKNRSNIENEKRSLLEIELLNENKNLKIQISFLKNQLEIQREDKKREFDQILQKLNNLKPNSELKKSSWTANVWRKNRNIVVAKCIQGGESLSKLYPSKATLRAMMHKELNIKQDLELEFHYSFENDFEDLKRQVSLQRGNLSSLIRRSIASFNGINFPKSISSTKEQNLIEWNSILPMFSTIYKRNYDRNQNLSGWHYDKDLKPFNCHYLILSLGKAFVSAKFAIGDSLIKKIEVSMSQLCFTLMVIEKLLKNPKNCKLKKDMESNFLEMKRWELRVKEIWKKNGKKTDEEKRMVFDRIVFRKGDMMDENAIDEDENFLEELEDEFDEEDEGEDVSLLGK